MIVLATEGNEPAAFDVFYATEWKQAERLAFLLLGQRELAEEVAQEAFAAASAQWES
jgi:DNA-directed RNA polymerase specialized sigma24 family protein